MPPPPTDLPTACRRAQQIGVALMLSTASYFFVAKLIAAQRAPFPGFAPSLPIEVLRVVFAAMAVAALLMLKGVTRQMLVAPARPVSAAHGLSLIGQRLFALSLTRLAICQAIAVFGFVLFLLGGHWQDFYAFVIASVGAFLFHFPRLSQLEE